MKRIIIFSAVVALAACSPGRPDPATADETARAAVRAALDRYVTASRLVDANAIAAFYTTTATLFEPGIKPIVGRDAIRTFMGSFPGVKVEVATATPDTVEVFGATVLIWGSYFERLAFTGQPVSEQHGRFVMEWVRQPSGEWLIERYYRIPLTTTTGG